MEGDPGEAPPPVPDGLVSPGGPPPAENAGQPWPTPYPAPNPAQYPGYPSPYGNRQLPPASRTMAGWALGLALVFCVPLVPLVGIVLGIVVLARCRDGRDHGKGLAIAAVVVGALAMLLQVVGFVGGVIEGFREGLDSTRRDESGNVVDGGEMLPTKLRMGDCFNDKALRDAGTEEVRADLVEGVPCSEPHGFEVFALLDIEGTGDGSDDHPGQAAIDAQAARCFPEFKKFVGVAYARSDLEVSYYFPTPQSWRLLGDRVITCVVWDPEEERLTASLRNARR